MFRLTQNRCEREPLFPTFRVADCYSPRGAWSAFCGGALIAFFAMGLSNTRADGAAPPLTDDGRMYIGVDYYPEHWPEERWKEDYRMMQEAGFNVVRIGEFAWSRLEPREGEFDFGWLERAIDGAHAHGLRVILGTPTAVMPAWLAHRYPEALAEKADGSRIVWGGRRHNSFTDQSFRRLAGRIVLEMAKRCADHPAVVGWQIDNELGGTDCRSENTRIGFQKWLKKKYGDLDELNRAWGNHFWGLQFAEWAEIPIPDDRTGSWSISNPSASLDWQRYGSDLNVEFLNWQIELLKGNSPPHHFYTHNLMGLYSSLDYYKLAENLDVVSWDNYPHLNPVFPYDAAMAGDLMRGLKAKNYWIMEQTAGPLGWGEFSATPLPGELRKICYQQMAHGCDAQIWFRWRTCTAGREQYWHGLLGHDGKAGRRYEEAARYASECRRLWSELSGTTIESQVAIIHDYESIWALDIQEGYRGASHQQAIKRYYRALLRYGVNVDFVSPDADLTSYRLVIAPHLHVMPYALAERLNAYVEQGGLLLADCRTGVKDATNLAHARTLPGRLSKSLGIKIPEYESASVGMKAPSTRTYTFTSEELGGEHTAKDYFDWVVPESASALGAYNEGSHLKGYAAVTRNAYGSGAAWYVGTVVEQDDFYDILVRRLTRDVGVTPLLTPPEGVEVSLRSGQGRRLLFVINHTSEQVEFGGLPPNDGDLLTTDPVGDTIRLEPFGVAVLRLPESTRVVSAP